MAVISSDIKSLVYARIQSMPNGTQISIGDEGTLTKEQVLNHIKSEDSIGKKMIEIEMEFFKSLKEGSIYDQES